MDDSIDFNETSYLYPMYFEDIFYCRTLHQTEEQELRTKEPHKFFAQRRLINSLRFCDTFGYIDTISVCLELVKTPQVFFDVMSDCTDSKCFQKECSFVFDQKSGIH